MAFFILTGNFLYQKSKKKQEKTTFEFWITFEFQKIVYDFSIYQFKIFNIQALFRLKLTQIDNIIAYTF